MDISFACAACGKSLVIDEAGAGITIDCPGCGKPVYVPSGASPSPQNAPARVEVKSGVRRTAPVAAVTAPKRPVMPSYSCSKQPSIHPAIAGGLHCLVIVTVMWIVAFAVAGESYVFASVLVYVGLLFVSAAFLCAVYAICVGHVRHGLLILGCLSLLICLAFLLATSFAGRAANSAQRDAQRQMEEMLRQVPQIPRH